MQTFNWKPHHLLVKCQNTMRTIRWIYATFKRTPPPAVCKLSSLFVYFGFIFVLWKYFMKYMDLVDFILYCSIFSLAYKTPQKTVQHMELEAAWCLKWEFHVCINSRFTICRKALFLMFTLTYFIIYLWLTFIEIWLQHLILLFKCKFFFKLLHSKS